MVMLAGPRKKVPRAYSKSDDVRWGRDIDRPSQMGSDQPLILQALPHKEKIALIKSLLRGGAGDCSIAVKINKMGFECSRSDVYTVRNGTSPPTGQGALEEYRLR